VKAKCQFQRDLLPKNGKDMLIISVTFIKIIFQLPFTTLLL